VALFPAGGQCPDGEAGADPVMMIPAVVEVEPPLLAWQKPTAVWVVAILVFGLALVVGWLVI
jgi:hypothetical protein